MYDILCIANDTGGARLLTPVIAEAASQGRSVRALASGPAEAMWSKLPVPVDKAPSADAGWLNTYIARHGSGVVLTGTSHFSDLERNSWIAARNIGIPTVGAIDAWVNFTERFIRTADESFVQPDHVCVIDESSRKRLAADPRVTAKVHVCGQPHLEILVDSLLNASKNRPANQTLTAVFFSNPVFLDLPLEQRPYDQFMVASLLVEALRNVEGLDLLIKPHPREDTALWDDWIAPRRDSFGSSVSLTQRESSDLLTMCDGVCGITSMGLVEASLLGLPVLSLQPGRLHAHNPVIDRLAGVNVAVSETKVPGAVKAWVDSIRSAERKSTDLSACIHNSRQNYLGLIEQVLGAAR
jgi:hypothetical protein